MINIWFSCAVLAAIIILVKFFTKLFTKEHTVAKKPSNSKKPNQTTAFAPSMKGKKTKMQASTSSISSLATEDTDSDAATDSLRTVTRADVAQHSDINDLWVVVSNNVYNLTDYVMYHPGGDIIARDGGGDATRGFNGDQHPDKVWTTIRDFKVGTLPKNEYSKQIAQADVDEKDNWHVVNGKVYDTTNWQGTTDRPQYRL